MSRSISEQREALEAGRLAAIAEYDLIGTPDEPEFAHIVRLAAALFDVPISLISIVDSENQVFSARVGLDAPSTPRSMSFCAHALDRSDTLVVEDAREDPRFADNPLVLGPPHIRFYAGAPLRVASGHVVGTLCIISPEPRKRDPKRVLQLEGLAQLVVDRLELRKSERKRRVNEERLARLAHFDQLTGLPNRACFHDRAARLLESDDAATVLLFDLDGFKDVNDILGHGVGDKLLEAVAERLRTETHSDHLLARLGGDEFALFVPNTGDPRVAHRIASGLRDSFRNGFTVDGEELQLDTSIGIAVGPHHGKTVEALLMAADLALYRAKDQGGGAVGFFEPHLRHKAEERQRLQSELRHAFAEEQFELLYQPQIDFGTGDIVGAEALLRWNHPVYGQLSPAHFISVLDRMPLAAAVGNWALRSAIDQAATWQRMGTPIRVGVNLFAAQFRSGNLPTRVSEKLKKHALPPCLLELELTETIVVKNSNLVTSALTAIHQQGIGIALDDFGTGYASLSLLKQLPVTRLKIDKEFVRDMAPGSCDKVVVDAIVRLGGTFGLHVIAEGVETAEQEEWLIQAGCDEGQGYRYGTPMSAPALTRLLRKDRPEKLPSAA